MNRFLSTLCALLITTITAQVSAQEQEFETVMTPAFSPITWERLVNSKEEPHNWLMYSGSLDAQRHSSLDEVNINNVADLELKWAYQIPEIDRAETVPLVVDGIMFITEAPSNVVAVDARTGRPGNGNCGSLGLDCGRNVHRIGNRSVRESLSGCVRTK